MARAVVRLTSGRPPAGPVPTLRVAVLAARAEDVRHISRLAALAQGARYRFVQLADAGAAITCGDVDIVLVDVARFDDGTLDLLRNLAARAAGIPVVVLTELCPPGFERPLVEAGIADVLEKEELEPERLDRCLRIARARAVASPISAGRVDAAADLHRAVVRAVALGRRRGTACAVLRISVRTPGGAEPASPADRAASILAQRLRSRLRASDTLIRLGPGEFALLVEDLMGARDAVTVAAKVRQVLDQPVELDGQLRTVSVDLGCAVFPDDAERPEALLRAAEDALAAARSDLPGPGRFAGPDLDLSFARTATLARDFADCVAAGALDFAFQPQTTLRAGTVGVAAILRWQASPREVVEGDDLRALAELAGQLDELTRATVAGACSYLRGWHDAGLDAVHLAIPVYGRRQLAFSGLAEQVAAFCAGHGVPPSALELEISARLIQEDLAAGGRALAALAATGIRIAAAGFAGPEASLGVLRDAPLHTLKLSRALLAGVPAEPRAAAFLRALVELARSIGLRVVAEGVETREQLQLLREAGCDAIQAIMVCPPLPESDARRWLERARRRGGA